MSEAKSDEDDLQTLFRDIAEGIKRHREKGMSQEQKKEAIRQFSKGLPDLVRKLGKKS